MMKKPLNRAISPIAPYGELAPVCGTSWSPTPKKTAQAMNRNVNRNFPFGLVIRRDPLRAALGGHRRSQHDHDHQDHDARGDPERDRLLEGDEEELHGRDASRRPSGRIGRPRVRCHRPPSHPATEAYHHRDPIRSTRSIRGAPRPVGGRRMGGPAARGAAVRAPRAGRPERGRLHPRRPRIGSGQGAPRARARRAAVGPRRRLHQPDPRGGHARLRGGSRRRRPRRALGTTRRAGRVAHARARPGVGRRPHGLRHRVPRPAARRLPRRVADPARSPPTRARSRRRRSPADRRSTATSSPCRSRTCSGAS